MQKMRKITKIGKLESSSCTCVLVVSCTTAFLKFNLVSAFPISVTQEKIQTFSQKVSQKSKGQETVNKKLRSLSQ